MPKPGAPKTVMNRARPGSGGSVALTLLSLAVLGLAIARLGPAAEIRAAEPVFVGDLGIESAQAQQLPDDIILAETARNAPVDWGPAFGHPPPPPAPVTSDPIVARPAPTPAPSASVAPEAPVARDRSDDYWLTGHILAGPDSVAMVHDGGNEQVVRQGSVLSGGEVVTEISAAGVVAEHDGQNFLIVLRDITQPAQPARQASSASAPDMASRSQQPSSRPTQPSRRSFLQQVRARDSVPAQNRRNEDDWADDDWDDGDWDDDDWDDDDWEDWDDVD